MSVLKLNVTVYLRSIKTKKKNKLSSTQKANQSSINREAAVGRAYKELFFKILVTLLILIGAPTTPCFVTKLSFRERS